MKNQSGDPVNEWFSRPKLGLFLHFGLYSIEGWHEQDQMRRRIPRATYEKLIHRFNPVDFDPDAILDLAESVGMEYICLTTKHHDGFCLWDTKETDYNIMNSPYGKDLLSEFAEACHRRNFPMGLYYSVVDWRHPNYPNQGRHHEIAGPEDGDVPDWDGYMQYLKAQVKELCSNYGEIRHFFWDMNVPEYEDSSINAMIRELQPNIVINNRGFDEGDFGTPEREWNNDAPASQQYTEACNSVGSQSWGFRKEEDYYTAGHLIDAVDGFMCKGAHYLLNVGPDGAGNIPNRAVGILEKIGSWYQKVRESFNEVVSADDLTQGENVRLTRRGNTIYVHSKRPLSVDCVYLPGVDVLPQRAVLLNNGQGLSCSNDVLPMRYKANHKILQVRGVPTSILDRDETLVIRLEFDDLSLLAKKV